MGRGKRGRAQRCGLLLTRAWLLGYAPRHDVLNEVETAEAIRRGGGADGGEVWRAELGALPTSLAGWAI